MLNEDCTKTWSDPDKPVLDEDVARLSPLRWRHANVLGRYEFELLPGVEAGDLWPLRDPNSVSELELALLHEDEE